MNKKHNTPPHNMAACRIKKILASTMQFSNTTHTTTSAEHTVPHHQQHASHPRA
ncbi:hypothetical protein [Corynebacterium bovis]|uniref:hypothetical protein n=1 Tax=Corynebacterium bovis TaxID=36808 RepID=UPI001639C420|nr:hypothetical protein [Corynebacterium bovis]